MFVKSISAAKCTIKAWVRVPMPAPRETLEPLGQQFVSLPGEPGGISVSSDDLMCEFAVSRPYVSPEQYEGLKRQIGDILQRFGQSHRALSLAQLVWQHEVVLAEGVNDEVKQKVIGLNLRNRIPALQSVNWHEGNHAVVELVFTAPPPGNLSQTVSYIFTQLF